SKADLTAYSQQLDGAAKYWRAIEIEAKRAGDEQRRAFARERAQEYQQALEGVEATLKSVADTSRDNARGTKELIEAWKTLGLQGDITGQQITEAGQKMLSALDVLVADARIKGDQLGAAFIAGIGKASTSAELGELQRRLDTLFEEG